MEKKLTDIARELLADQEDFVVSRILDTAGSTPRKSGAWMITTRKGNHYGTVGGGKIEAAIQELALKTFETKSPCEQHHFALNTEEKNALDMGCGGEANVELRFISGDDPGNFIDDFAVNSHVYIFGGGHVGLALEPILRHIGFFTTVLDDREEFANKKRFPRAGAVKVIKDMDRGFEGLSCNEDTFVVIVTRGHQGDYQILREALKQKTKYVGMIGSRTKNQMIFDKLREEGVSQDLIDRVYAPIGERIYAETPEEIGISIAAEIIKVRAGHGTR